MYGINAQKVKYKHRLLINYIYSHHDCVSILTTAILVLWCQKWQYSNESVECKVIN